MKSRTVPILMGSPEGPDIIIAGVGMTMGSGVGMAATAAETIASTSIAVSGSI